MQRKLGDFPEPLVELGLVPLAVWGSPMQNDTVRSSYQQVKVGSPSPPGYVRTRVGAGVEKVFQLNNLTHFPWKSVKTSFILPNLMTTQQMEEFLDVRVYFLCVDVPGRTRELSLVPT